MMRTVTRATVGAALLTSLLAPAAATAGPDLFLRDEFKAISYAGDDGTLSWQGPWTEVGTTDGPTAGVIQVVNASQCAGSNCLRIGDTTISQDALHRKLGDMRAYTSATLSMRYRREHTSGSSGQVWLQITPDGLFWSTLGTFRVNATDTSLQTFSADIGGWLGPATEIRFNGSGNLSGYLHVDDVEVWISGNTAPVFDSSPPDRADAEADTVSFAVTATDPDGDTVTYAANGLPPGASIDEDTGLISGTIAYTAASSSPYTTTILADDGFGGVTSIAFTWSVSDVNRPPSVEAIPDVTIDEDEQLDVRIEVDDADLPDDAHFFSITDGPAGATVSTTGVVTWSPSESDGPGVHRFAVDVTDSGVPPATASVSFVVTVAEVNEPPQLAAIADQTSGAGDTVAFDVIAGDPDDPANTLTFSATGLPPGVSIDPKTGRISGTIPFWAEDSSGNVKVAVADDGIPSLTDDVSFRWTITRSNRAPVLDPIGEQTPDATGLVTFTARASDPDGDDLRYWMAEGSTQVPDGAVIDPATGVFTWRPADNQLGTSHGITIGVTDDGSPSLSATTKVTIVVPRPNEPPVLLDPGDQVSAEGDVIDLKITTVDLQITTADVQITAAEPDAAVERLTFAAAGLPPDLVIERTTGRITGTIGFEAAGDSPYTVTVTVTDDGVPPLSGEITFEWTVENTNRPPEVLGAKYGMLAGDTLRFELEATDPDGDDLVIEPRFDPRVGLLALAGSVATYQAPAGFEGEVVLGFVASDGELKAEADVLIVVRGTNVPPEAADDVFEVAADDTLIVASPGVMGNDEDPDGDPLLAAVAKAPTHGRLLLSDDGAFTYEPEPGFVGLDWFTYTASDPFGATDVASVRISVLPAGVTPAGDPAPPVPRADVVMSTQRVAPPPPADVLAAGGDTTGGSRMVVTAVRAGFATVPQFQFPMLLVVLALALGLTVGRLSLAPFLGRRMRGTGVLRRFDDAGRFGFVDPSGGGSEIYVHARAVRKAGTLRVGETVRFVAVATRGRLVATRVRPA